MALTATLAQMRTRVRQVTDQEQSTFIADSEINTWINQGIREVWRLLVTQDPDRGTTTSTVSTTAGTTEYTLPSDFMSLRGLDYPISSTRFAEVHPYAFQERNQWRNASTATGGVGAPCRYKLLYGDVTGAGIRLSLLPDPGTASYTLWYIAVPATLSNDGDTFDGIIGFDDYPVYWAALQVRAKCEEDPSVESAVLAEIKERIKQEAPRRDRSGIQTVARLRGRRPSRTIPLGV